MKEKLKRLIPTKRKIMQLYFALLFNANLKGFINGEIFKGNSKIFCAPGINCYSCPGAVAACPLGSLQGAFSSYNRSTLYYVGGILLLYCLMFGRMICGWLCPFGLVQELVHKIKTPKLKKSRVTRLLSWFKYVVLVVFVGIVPLTYGWNRHFALPAFCKYICPIGTLEGGIGLMWSNADNLPVLTKELLDIIGPLFTWKFLLMVAIIVGSIFIFRLFCRFICPLGALYGIFNRISIFGIKLEKSKCTDCGLCQAHCKVDIKHVGDQECISCGECIDVCPTKAISWKGPKIFLAPNETSTPEAAAKHKKLKLVTRTISAVLLIGLLVGVMVYAWKATPDPVEPTVPVDTTPVETVDPNGSIPADPTGPVVGIEPGNLCPSASLQIVTPDGVMEETVDPTASGKVTLINFWGVWCGPCVAELPYFDQIATEYGDQVAVYAIHTSSAMLGTEAPGFVGTNYPDSAITFLMDTRAEGANTDDYYSLLGGRSAYPYTFILDENGIVVKVIVSSTHYEELVAVIDPLLSD